MAPPHHAPRPQETMAQGGEHSAAAASKLQRFAHVPQSTQGLSQTTLTVTAINPITTMAEDTQPLPLLSSPMVASPAQDDGGAQTMLMSEDPPTEPTMRDVYSAISACNTTLASLHVHIGDLKADMSYVRKDMQAINERVKATEERISTVEDQLSPMSKDLKRATQQIAFLLNKVDDLENRSRRNNVRVVGVPEKSEGKDPVSFFESWLADIIGKEQLSSLFAIERAHRVPLRPPPPGAPPRPILLKLLNFRDRDVALRVAREKGELSINGHRVSLYPDFSGEIQRQRLQFQDIKKRLRALNIPYSMQYPAKLRVVALNTTNFFESPKAALTWLDTNERLLRGSGGPG